MIAAESVDLSGGWDELWSRLSAGATHEQTRLLTLLGVTIVAFGVIRWVVARSRGRDRGKESLPWMILLGALLAAPEAIAPLLFNALDAGINFLIAAAS